MNPLDWYFNGWEPIVRMVATAPAIYVLVIAAVRVSGKRSTSQLNNFDWIVTVAMGSILGSAVVLSGVAVALATLAVAALLAMQYAVTWSAARWAGVRRVVQSKPALVFYRGECLEDALRAERLSGQEVRAAIREAGYWDQADVEAVVLEADASLSVLGRDDARRAAGPPDILDDLDVPE